jgi:phosphate transport system protein
MKADEAIKKALDSLVNNDLDLAQDVIHDDTQIDEMEKVLCDQCALIIAKEQPVAGDLRHLISAIKIITDIERIADHAVHIAKGTIKMSGEEYIKPLIDIPRMGQLCSTMLTNAINAYVNQDSLMALGIAQEDKIIDQLHQQIIRETLTYMLQDSQNIEKGLGLMYISRFLERIGDHIRNICEWVVFDETGKHEDL